MKQITCAMCQMHIKPCGEVMEKELATLQTGFKPDGDGMQQEPQGLEGYRREDQNVKVVFSNRIENQSDFV